MRVFALITFTITLPSSAALALGKKKLIEFGWDEPGTAFMREHIGEMKRTPFDGCVFHINYTKEDGSEGSFTWECWSKRTFTRRELQPALQDLTHTDFGRFRHNFLRFNVCPGDVDWFDDFGPILENARLAGWLVGRSPGVEGILFDIEQYNAQLFNYGSQRDAETKSFEKYARQVRRRGRELMEAFQSECPDVTIFLTFGYCLPWYETEGKRQLSEASYGLLAPLLDGMIEAAGKGVRFIDGHESSYPYKTLDQFKTAYELMKTGVLPIVSNPVRYGELFGFSFGIWLDCGWKSQGWDTQDFLKNHFTPEAFLKSVESALSVADEYVWVYSETPRWWTPAGGPEKLPQEYFNALGQAKLRWAQTFKR